MEAPHPHPNHGKKKWTDYFWEFFMLFLAVTLGFFVENQREHYIEHQREKLYMKAMVADLEKDTVMLADRLIKTKDVVNNINLVLDILVKENKNDTDISLLYKLNLSLLSNISPGFMDRTSVQLKNAGAMRLIRNEASVDGIINYWNQGEAVKSISAALEDFRIKARERSYSIFDQRYFNDSTTTPKLMIKDPLQLTEFANRLAHIKNLANNRYRESIEVQIKNAKELIETINNNY